MESYATIKKTPTAYGLISKTSSEGEKGNVKLELENLLELFFSFLENTHTYVMYN